MRIHLAGDNPALWQWDIGRQIELVDADRCTEIHFAHQSFPADSAPVVPIREVDGARIADIPNVLLQRGGLITAYAYICEENGAETIYSQRFNVRHRPRPADYVYTETETKTWEALDERIRQLEENGGTVKSVNGNSPDESGNVTIDIPDPIIWKEEKSRKTIVEDAVITKSFASVSWLTYDIAVQYDAMEVVCNGVTYVCPVIKGAEEMVGYFDSFVRIEGTGFTFSCYKGGTHTCMGKTNATYTMIGIKYTYHRLPEEYAPKLNSPGYRKFELGVTDDGVLTTTNPRGEVAEMAKKTDIPGKASAVADATGETVTGEEFNALLTALREAGYLSA